MRKDDQTGRAEWMRNVMNRYEAPLIRYAAHITGDLDTARDVVQDTFLRLCDQNPAALNSHLAQWLFTVCRNRAIDVHRKSSRQQPLTDEQLAVHPSTDPSPAAQASNRDATNRILHHLADLPRNQQEVIRLKFQLGLSYKAISAVTKLSVSNVGFLIHTAVHALRNKMKAEEGAHS